VTTSLRELEKRLAQEPENLPLRVTVAGMLRESGRATEAVEHYRRVAIAYRAQGRQQQALAVCRSILELAPDDIAIHALLAELTEPKTPVPAVPGQKTASGTGSGGDATNTKVRAAPSDDIDIEFSDPGLHVDEPTRDPKRDDEPNDEDDETRPPPATGSRPPANAFAKVPSPAGTRGDARTPAAGSPKSSPPGELRAPPTGSSPPKPSQAPLPHVPKADARTPAVGTPKSVAPGSSSPKSSPPMVRSAPGSGSPKSSPPVMRIPPKTKSAPPASALAPAPPTVPPHRPSFEIDTPLPRPIPYHIADPTSSQMKLAREEAERESRHDSNDDAIETRPGEQNKPTRLKPETDTTGLAQAARRISGLISPNTVGAPKDLDLAAELDTRQRPRLSAEDLAKVQDPPPTVPTEQVVLDDELPTPLPRTTWTKGPPIRDTPMDPPTDLHAALPVRDTRLDVIHDEDHTDQVDLVGANPLANAFFTSLPPNRRDGALARCIRRDARGGSIVIRQGETAHSLILVVTGQLELRVERANGSVVVLDTIHAGQYIGEAALLGRTPAQATIVALIDSELLALPPHALFELAGAYPALWAALKDTAERRTRHYEKLLRG
jgi:Cyclic nucleotide-binding domain